MRTRIDGKKLRLAGWLTAAAVIPFGLASVTWSATTPESCVAPGRAESVIHQCVAERAAAVQPTPVTLVALVAGGLALSGAIVIAARGTHRVMTIAKAAEELDFAPGQVRKLIEAGILDVSEQDAVSTYLDPEQVRRISPSALAHPGTSQPST